MRLTLSRSTWACELKYCVLENVCKYICHAPRERVSWNTPYLHSPYFPFCHAPRERVSWNRCYLAADCLRWRHAPRERVSWNERSAAIVDFQPWSRSTWACELKLSVSSADRLYIRVTLHVSVWVEMMIAGRFSTSVSSRSTWACELKYTNCVLALCVYRHAPRERVSWNYQHFPQKYLNVCHAPRERVSWNRLLQRGNRNAVVTLHVSVWVEIPTLGILACSAWVTLHVSVWVEMEYEMEAFLARYVTLHVSVWVEIQDGRYSFWQNLSRSTWACELKWSFWETRTHSD